MTTIYLLEMNSLLNVNTTLLACMPLAEYYGNHLLNLGRHSRCVFALLHPRNLKIKPEPRKTLNKKRKKRKQVARSWSPRHFFLSLYLCISACNCLLPVEDIFTSKYKLHPKSSFLLYQTYVDLLFLNFGEFYYKYPKLYQFS